jgi:hypothetical protein
LGKTLHEAVFEYPETLASISVLTAQDVGFFFELFLPDGVEKEIERFFRDPASGRLLSAYVRDHEDGFQTLENSIDALAQKNFHKRVDEMSIEALIFDHYNSLHERIAPDSRLASFNKLLPFVQVREPAGEEKIEQIYSVGLANALESKTRKTLEVSEANQVFSFFSHQDNSKIIVLCQTTNFSARYLTQLKFYKEAYTRYLKKSSKAKEQAQPLHHPDFMDVNLEDF